MNNLKINVTVPSLSQLTPVAPNTYLVPVKFFNSSGAPLNNSNIPNSYVASVVTISNSFSVNVPITDATFTANNVTIKAYTDNVTNCCFAVGVYNIVNTESGGGAAMSAKIADFGYPEHFEMEWTGTSKNWVGRDLSTVSAPPNYHLRYFIGSEILIRDTPLVNYEWKSNNMITIIKGIVKNGVDDLYFYGLNSGDPLRRPDDGYSMSTNVSFSFGTWFFNSASNADT